MSDIINLEDAKAKQSLTNHFENLISAIGNSDPKKSAKLREIVIMLQSPDINVSMATENTK